MSTAALEARPAEAASPGAPDRAVVEVRGLTKEFPVRRGWKHMLRAPRDGRRVIAVDRASFEVGRGEFFGLLGPNGAGKTTVLKMLSTLIVPDRGTARVAGHDLLRDPDGVRSVLVPVIADERSLNWRLSAYENMRFYAALYGLRGPLRDRKVEELLGLVGLSEVGQKIVGAFSSGMRQRLLLARALLGDPRVLLLDEPTRSLDPLAARQFRGFLRRQIAGERGCTVLLATHNTEEALELCDRVAVLDHGAMIAVGRPRELARGLGNERYRVWTRSPDHPAFRRLERSRRISSLERHVDDEGWSILEMTIAGDGDGAEHVLGELVRQDAGIARFEKVRLPLADVIERLLPNGDGEGMAGA